jgi:hypothetical protein
MKCPKCSSTDLRKHEIVSHGMEHCARHYAAHGWFHGHPAVGAVALLGWLAIKGINALAHGWTCTGCGHRFS